PGLFGGKGITSSYSLKQKKFADDFHIFAVEWEPDAIRFYCDDAHYKTITTRDLPEATKWVYDHPHFILLNAAVGENGPAILTQLQNFLKRCWSIMCAFTNAFRDLLGVRWPGTALLQGNSPN